MAVTLHAGKNQFFAADGSFLASGKLYTYVTGTSTPKAAYQDAAGTTPHANPIVLDSRGEATIYWSGTYDVTLKTAADVTIWGPIKLEQPEASGAAAAVSAALVASGGSALVGFLQSGSGATSRPAQSKMRDWFSVKDFGALGDGTTDDTSAIQSCIDAAETAAAGPGGWGVYFPPSTSYYKITSPLVANASGLTLFGAGAGSQIYNATGNCLEVGDNVTTRADCHIIGLNLQCSGNNSIALRPRKATNITIRDCIIISYDTGGIGIQATDSFCARIVGNTFGSIKGYGIHISSNMGGTVIRDNRIDGFSTSSTCGIYADSVSGLVCTGNTVETWGTCINCKSVQGANFSNYMEGYVTGYLFDSASAEGNRIGGYFASTGSTVSIKLTAGVGYTIDGVCCVGTHSGGAPIEVTSGAGDVFISGNIVHDDAYYVKWPRNHLALRQHLEWDRSIDDSYGYITPVTHTGTVAETTLKTHTGVKEHWGTGTRIDVRVAGRITGTAGQKDIRLKLAGTTIGTVTEAAGSTDDWIIEASIDIASATVGQAVVKAWQGAAVEVGDVVQGGGVTLALDTTNPTITVTGQLGNTADSIIVTHWMIELRN